MQRDAPELSSNRRLARLFTLESADEGAWGAAELAAVVRHQWRAPVELELGGVATATATRLRAVATGCGAALRSYGDLFTHPAPPLELLTLVKDYAKAHVTASDSPLPREVALALYYGSIFAAFVRLGQRLTQLGDGELAGAAAWLARQPWTDSAARELAEAARARLAAAGPSPDSPLEPRAG
jgi:hypothetical protein